ncbi:centromere protein O [Astyanax mexicanus]|uniref:Centromere protein O n=2 Tax=Astyanax mexicanus TaxID=7994 RepID=A0A8B9H0S8_ASTMX|nr:centromere protein O [Astyanax mexicanus]KAG9268701.1 centromere protein O-like [Astyanax mexicanus]
MDIVRKQGVFDHLMVLEKAGTTGQEKQKQDRLDELRSTIVTLRAKRDRLSAETAALKSLQNKLDQGQPLEVDEADDLMQLDQFLLKSRLMQLKDLQTAYHLIGGYNLIENKQGKSICVSFCTAYGDMYLETFNLEMDLRRTVQISRHNIPPCIPLDKLAKENLQTDFKAFLETLSLHLNALAGRKQQISLIKELVGTVEVIEKNQLCNFLVLMCKAQESEAAILCTLEYSDLTKCLPTRVTIQSKDTTLAESPQWKKNQALLMESPVHIALLTLRKMGSIV